jgi:hypothetical protein
MRPKWAPAPTHCPRSRSSLSVFIQPRGCFDTHSMAEGIKRKRARGGITFQNMAMKLSTVLILVEWIRNSWLLQRSVLVHHPSLPKKDTGSHLFIPFIWQDSFNFKAPFTFLTYQDSITVKRDLSAFINGVVEMHSVRRVFVADVEITARTMRKAIIIWLIRPFWVRPVHFEALFNHPLLRS